MNSEAEMTRAGGESEPLLEVRGLRMQFPIRRGAFRRTAGFVKAVNDVSFHIRQGETLSLVGESGCGKTTTGRCIARVYQPTAGEILYKADGAERIDLAELGNRELRPFRREIRMIFQDPFSSLNPRLSILQIVGESLKVNGVASGSELEDRVASLLRRVGLRPEYLRRYPHAFSGGERQRIGIAHEYNSPTYSFVLIEALHKIVAFSQDAEARMLSRLIVTRIGLSVALRLHPATGRLAPPHCRAYYPALVCATPPEAAAFGEKTAENLLPAWLETLRSQRPLPLQVRETSDSAAGVVASSYLDAEFSLGLATQELATQSNRFISNQSNVFSIHYAKAAGQSPGVVFSRYLINDRWLGDFRTTPSRSSDTVFRDEGSFRGALAGPCAFGLYTSPELNAWQRCFSAKAALIWSGADDIDEVWIDDRRVSGLPAQVEEGAAVVVACGEVYILIRPLARAKLGVVAPVIMTEHRGSFVIEMYNYLGAAKTFWELANPGAFFQGYAHNGFFVEVAAKRRYRSGEDFFQAFARGQLDEDLERAITFDGVNSRQWRLAYRRDEQALGMDVDLMRWRIQRRWAGEADLGYPMLESAVARQSRSGRIELGGARLTTKSGNAAWLVCLPEAELWAVAYHGLEESALTLDIGERQVHIERLDAGIVVWNRGRVTIEALGLHGEPRVVGAESVGVVRYE